MMNDEKYLLRELKIILLKFFFIIHHSSFIIFFPWTPEKFLI